jgi:hypothetical protein
VHTEPPLLLESAAARPVLYTIGVVGFVLFSWWWTWRCPKHVETPINTSSFLHLVVYLFTFKILQEFAAYILGQKNNFSWRFLWNVVLTSHNIWHQARHEITTLGVSNFTTTQGCQSVLWFCLPVIVTEILGISTVLGWKFWAYPPSWGESFFGHIHRLGLKILGISIVLGWKYHKVSELEFASVLKYNEERLGLKWLARLKKPVSISGHLTPLLCLCCEPGFSYM